MADDLNPGEKNVAASDYEAKFNRKLGDNEDLKSKEAAGDATWKMTASKKKKEDSPAGKKALFGFKGRRAGKLRQGSAFVFIIAMLGVGVWYTSVLAPNILLVNIKEMYTNDLADATTALEIYTQIMYFNKIGPTAGQGCDDQKSVKCKLTTMSRSQKAAFEQQGWLVVGTKVQEDNRDDGDSKNDLPESRYKVLSLVPPNYSQIIDTIKAGGTSAISNIINGNGGNASDQITNVVNQLLNPLKDAGQSPQSMLNSLLANAPIVSGPQLWLYSQLSTTTKEQVFSVFHPKASFFTDERYKQRIKTRYNMTKNVTTTGKTEQQVNKSFDRSVQKVDGAIDSLTGQTNPTDGVSLASLSSPLSLTQLQGIASQLVGGVSVNTVSSLANQMPAVADLQIAGNLLATNTYSYTDLMCSWYTIGKMSSNAIIRAKASTAARYAMQYLKAADAIKAGTSDEVSTNVLASKLAQHAIGGYNGGSATDSMIYRSITYGDIVPNSLGDFGSMVGDPSKLVNLLSDAASIVAYNLSAYESIATLAPSWMQVIPNSGALAGVTGAPGMLAPPPLNLGGADREYCVSGETQENKSAIKPGDSQTTKCIEAINAMAPIGMQPAMAGATQVAGQTCPEPHYDEPHRTFEGEFLMAPSQKIVQAQMTPYIAAWFGINTMLASAVTQQLYTSQIKGIPANYALFSGMGEILGDMAMSRGLMPSNAIDMELYLNLGEVIGAQNNLDELDRFNARKNPFDPYNKFSFVGSIVNGLTPATDSETPLLATMSNIFSVLGTGAQKAGQLPAANAFYHIQPSLLTQNDTIERMAGYLLRLSGAFCPLDLEYLAIGIMPDIMCNVRYSMPLEDITTAINLQGVLDYMTQSHSDAYQSQLDELDQRIAAADPEGNKEYLIQQRAIVSAAQQQPYIDKETGKPTPYSEYDKYLTYCVNRADPWGRSAIGIRYEELPIDEKERRYNVKSPDGEALDRNDPGDPNQKFAGGLPIMAVTGTKSDQDWYTGKKCTRMTNQMEMLRYFRVYYMLCSVDGSMSGTIDCTEPDHEHNYNDPFYLNNDILYTSWY